MTKGIEISDQDVVAMDKVALGVVGLRIVQVNVYAVSTSDSWVLVDAGLPRSAGRIRRWADFHFGETRPSAILLTHAHFDHVGGFPEILRGWECPVYAHPMEIPFLKGFSKYPPPDMSAGGGIMSLLAPFYPPGPIDLGENVQPFPADGKIPGLSDWRWIHTPGHTAGHVSFFRESDRTLLAGDAFSTAKQESLTAIANQRPELHGPPAYYTSDWDAAKNSVEMLANLKPMTAAAGHGAPMTGVDVPPKLDELARNFDTTARPRTGRRAA